MSLGTTRPPLVLGSGKFGTPCERMHCAYLSSGPPLAAAARGLPEDPHPAIRAAQITAAKSQSSHAFAGRHHVGALYRPGCRPDDGRRELNKLASNIYQSRNMSGVHYRSDGYQSLLLGEAVAISILQDQKRTYNENFQGFTFTKFDGTKDHGLDDSLPGD